MTLFSYYLQFLTEICEGTRPLPAGMTLTQTDEMQRAIELQTQIQSMGIPAFVRACAAESGIEIPESAYEGFDEHVLLDALQSLPTQSGETDAAADASAASAEAPADDAPAEPVRSEIRDIYEVFLDSVCLDDALLSYLIDILKRGARDEFETLSHAAARTILDIDDFLAWLGNKELLAPVEERACVRIMDGCMERLLHEGKRELLAALLSGDEATFCAFRAEAPELCHLPDATYAWYCENYLDRYYPARFFMRCGGVNFPIAE